MKKRHLRKWIQTVLEVVSLLIIMFFCMLNDFELSVVPVLFCLLAILGLNGYVLNKYGKYEEA